MHSQYVRCSAGMPHKLRTSPQPTTATSSQSILWRNGRKQLLKAPTTNRFLLIAMLSKFFPNGPEVPHSNVTHNTPPLDSLQLVQAVQGSLSRSGGCSECKRWKSNLFFLRGGGLIILAGSTKQNHHNRCC